MSDGRSVKKSFRLTEAEYEALEGKMKVAMEKHSFNEVEGFSGFVRESLLERHGIHTPMLRQQMRDLMYQLRKIGVNINQIAKKANSGLGTPADMAELLGEMEYIENMLDDYREKVEAIWQSRS